MAELEGVMDDAVDPVQPESQERQDTSPPFPWLFQVSRDLLDLNKAAYHPRLFSIAPFRCIDGFFVRTGLPKYWEIYEIYRHRRSIYLDKFFDRDGQRATREHFKELIEEHYTAILDSSRPAFNHQQKKQYFVEMLVENAVFIIELFLRFSHPELTGENDDFLSNPLKMDEIRHDLILVENQLPFFILKKLYEKAFPPPNTTFLDLTYKFFRPCCIQKESILNGYISHLYSQGAPEHFTDLLRKLHRPSQQYLDELRRIEGQVRERGQERGEYLYSAVLLHEAGVKFKVDANRNLFEVTFSEGNCLIPPLKVDDWTEPFFRNLMAWEQFHYYPNETYICGYVSLMRYLINSKEDVDLLVRKRIIINRLGRNEEVVTLFNDLCKYINVEDKPYDVLFEELNAYSAVRCHRWMANLKLEYFATLWKGAAAIVAVISIVIAVTGVILGIITFIRKTLH